MLITRTAFFIGYSRSDQDFLHIDSVIRSRLGRFQRMPYMIQFGIDPTEVESLLNEHLHVISLTVQEGQSKGEVLTEFFATMQRQLDIMAGKEFRETRPEAFESISEETLEQTYHAPDASSLFSGSSSLCFVMMPFGPEFDRVYRVLIRPTIEQSGLTPLRADEFSSSGPITEKVRVAIQQSRLCIVDLSGNNPNVLYELGVAQALGKPLILTARRGEYLPLDIAGMVVIIYDPDAIEDARPALRSMLESIQGETRLDAAERLIATGVYRGGVAVLGVLLEHALQRLLELTPQPDSTEHSSRVRPISSGQMLRTLAKTGRVTADDSSALSRFLTIRNKAVHQLEEPTHEEAQLALSILRDFVQRYFAPDSQPQNYQWQGW